MPEIAPQARIAEPTAGITTDVGISARGPLGRRDASTRGSIDRIKRKSSAKGRSALVPPLWNTVAIFVAVAMALCATFGTSIPPLVSIVSAALAGGIAASAASLAPRFAFGQNSQEYVEQAAVAAAFIVTPIALTSLAFSYWIINGGLEAHWGVASIVSLLTLTTALLGRRSIANFTSHAACWTAYAILDGSFFALGATAAGISMLALILRHRLKSESIEADRQNAIERVQHRAEGILRDYEDTGQGWFWETDRRGQLTYISDSVSRILRQEEGALEGRSIVELFDLSTDNPEGERTLNFHLSARSAFTDLSVRANNPNEERWWTINGRPIFDDYANFCGFRGSGTDLTEKRKSAEHASRLALFDSLTGLANRVQMSQGLEKILAAPMEMHRECAVFLLDLDRFKHVNDTLGHPAGDALLKQVAQRLSRAVSKTGQVGRLGGDEFQVIVPGRIDVSQLSALASDIIASLSQPYSVDGQRVVIGASIGIALSPADGDSNEALIRNADLALYAAKDGGRGRYHFYAADLHSKAEERSRLEQDLREAIAAGQLELHYQPVVSTTTEKISGFEALMRWKHPEAGWVSPGKFIPVAEESGLIHAIGEWAIFQACADLSQWPEDVRCAVNVSAIQFANSRLPAIVEDAVSRHGIDPSRLELEITESVFLADDIGTDTMFAALKDVGVRLALDDFGTGYSSLGYLKKAPFDKIKIDQSFVRGATEPGSRNGAIIASITSLAQALGMDTTAEGVESLDELEMMRMFGCSHVQGYIYERPLDAQGATERLRTGLAAVARGPKSARAARQSMLRKVVLEHQGQHYNGTIRNISLTGALVEGLWNVPIGTIFRVSLSESTAVTATARWSTDDRIGVEFAVPLDRHTAGRFTGLASVPNEIGRTELRRSA